LLAIVESSWLTALRTGLGSAIATDVLARRDARVVGLIGAGLQATAYIAWLRLTREIDHVMVFDIVDDRATLLVDALRRAGLRADSVDSAKAVAAQADLLTLATWSRQPLVGIEDVRAGTHVTSLGADEPGKQELGRSLLTGGLLVVDDDRLASNVLQTPGTELGAILRGEEPGRTSEDQTTVYSPVGLPMQDCVVTWHIYQRAKERGLGRTTDLLDSWDGGSLGWLPPFVDYG
jgi:ornithine cyclodeaminase/alanine dehydrogenase-like protein (mu-crystallin family)